VNIELSEKAALSRNQQLAAPLKAVKFLCSHSLHIVLSLQTEKLLEQELCTNSHHLKRLDKKNHM